MSFQLMRKEVKNGSVSFKWIMDPGTDKAIEASGEALGLRLLSDDQSVTIIVLGKDSNGVDCQVALKFDKAVGGLTLWRYLAYEAALPFPPRKGQQETAS